MVVDWRRPQSLKRMELEQQFRPPPSPYQVPPAARGADKHTLRNHILYVHSRGLHLVRHPASPYTVFPTWVHQRTR
jgi:hypothetical protein